MSACVYVCGSSGGPGAAADIQARFNNVNNPSERRRRSARDGNWVILGLFACWAYCGGGRPVLKPFRTRVHKPHRCRRAHLSIDKYNIICIQYYTIIL